MSIKQSRVSAGLTQQQVADIVKVSRTAVTMWEGGQVYPRMETLIALAKLFHCTVDDLLSE